MKLSRILLIVTLASAIFLLFWLIANAGYFLVKKDKLTRADAFVVLMGSISDRALQTNDLYQQGWAPKVLLVEEGMEGFGALKSRGVHLKSNTDQFMEALIGLGINEDNIIKIPGPARSTQNEAILIRNFLLKEPSMDTLIVVSSSPHARRASMIFKKALENKERKFYVMVSPSIYTSYNPDGWWKRREDIQYTLSEYLKILNFQLLERFKLSEPKIS
ncbi:MAG: YdcF family protein [Lentimicrobium sp.]|jgi:uncharacterized SAM-binding protein YcdF (DUF218 family)|nr:YdcF family protein [Lentimicrobium sp.]